MTHALPELAFTVRAEARAILVAAGEMSLHDAADGLQADAVAGGLVDRLGQDAVQKLMADAFERALAYTHTMAESAPPLAPIEEPTPPPRRALATSTVDALRYVIAQRDPARLRRFLAHRGRDELAAMRRLMGAT
jgi:hypothetical protein